MHPPLSANPTIPDNAPCGFDSERDDEDLLRDWRASRDEPAFRLLVRRHFPAVWSAARRLVNGDAALAEDISQEVFTHLATHAGSLPPRVVLGGWLHRHTCFTAAKAVRAASRRRSREQLAAAMNHSHHQQPPDPSRWPDIAPHLDAALNALPSADRDAVVLRFFEKRGFSAIACALNTSEDAVRMRTSRALEKLRRILGKHSGLLTTAVLAGLLRENSVAAAATTGTASAETAARIATAALSRAAALPAAATGATAGFTALAALLRGARPAIIGGAAVFLAVGAAWKWNAGFHSQAGNPPASALSLKPAAAGAPKTPSAGEVDVTVHFILVPEAEALALMNQRWSGDGDTELLAKLLKEAGPASASGVRVAEILTGSVPVGQLRTATSGDPGSTLLQKIRQELPTAPQYRNKVQSAPPKGKPESMKVGGSAEMQVTLSDDRQWCDLNIAASWHFADPVTHAWPQGPEGAPAPAAPAVTASEFRETKVFTQVLLRMGESALIQCSQLPALTGGESSPSTLRLLTFVTAQPVSPS